MSDIGFAFFEIKIIPSVKIIVFISIFEKPSRSIFSNERFIDIPNSRIDSETEKIEKTKIVPKPSRMFPKCGPIASDVIK